MTRTSRRTFLKLGAAFGAACALPAQHTFASSPGLDPPPLVASALPLPWPHLYFPHAETLLHRRLDVFDLLLVPAHTAAELIRRGALESIPGSPGRAHDPEGAFTIPFVTMITALVYRGAAPASLHDLWTRDALWPDSPRLVVGAALLRRGYPLNDTHPGHLAQVEKDLLRLCPRLVPDPLASLQSGLASLALALVPLPCNSTNSAGEGLGMNIPPEGAALVEYDWAIPRGARNAGAAQAFIAKTQHGIHNPPYRRLSPWDAPPSTPHASRLTPLTPLPPAARAQRAAIWLRVKRAAHADAQPW